MLREERLIPAANDPGWDEQRWFADLLETRGEHEWRAARDLYDWTHDRDWWNTFRASQGGVWKPLLLVDGREYSPIAVYTSGRVAVLFHVGGEPPFDAYHTRFELLRRVNQIPDFPYRPEASTKPSIDFRLKLLADNDAALEELKGVLEWVETEARKTA